MALTSTEEALVRQLLDQQAAILSLAGNESTITSKLGATKVTLADLVAANSVADADLLLTRQGTTDKSVRADILATYMGAELGTLFAPIANPTFTGGPKAPTPAQFDNDTSLATTAFVQRALGGYGQSFAYGTAAQTITPDRVNSTINLFGTCSSIILPLTSACPVGSVIFFSGVSLDCAVQRQGTDTIWANGTNASLTSITLRDGGSLLLVNKGAGNWFASGTPILQYAAEFAKSLSTNGWQRLPSGLIIQWGKLININYAQKTYRVTFPIAFPNAFLNGSVSLCQNGYNSDVPSAVVLNTPAASYMDVGVEYYTIAVTGDMFWFAIGY